MRLQILSSNKIPLAEKSLIFFVLASYLQVAIYTLNLLLPDLNTSIFNIARLFFAFTLTCNSLNPKNRFRPFPIFVVLLLLLSLIYMLPFAFHSPLRLTSGLISFIPLLLLTSCIGQSNLSEISDTKTITWLRVNVKCLLTIALSFCLINEYLWKVGIMPNKFGGAISFYGLLPRNPSFFTIPGTSGAFVFACLVLLCYLNTLAPSSQRSNLSIYFIIGFGIILAGSAGAAFVSLIIFILFYYPQLSFLYRAQRTSFSLLNALSRLSLLFIPISILSLILRRKDVLSSVSGRFSILDYFISQLGGISLLPNPDFFGLATNYAQSAFGSSSFVQTPDSLFVSLLVQYGVILTVLVLICLLLPLIWLAFNFLNSLLLLRSPYITARSLLGISTLLGSLIFMITSNILESYPLVFFLSFLYSSPLLLMSRVSTVSR